MPSIMNTSFVAFLSLSVAALSSFYLNIYTKFPIISIETIPSLSNITKMVDSTDAARILLQEKRARERDVKLGQSKKRQRKWKRRSQNAKQANDKKRKSNRKVEGNDVGSNTNKKKEDEVKEEVMKNEEEQGDENVMDVTMGDERDDILWFGMDHEGCCANCFRRNIPCDDVYSFSMCRMYCGKREAV